MCEFIPVHLNANYDETKSTEAGLGSCPLWAAY